MVQPAAVVAALALIFLSSVQLSIAQWLRGTGENLAQDISSDYMYRFRVAVTPKSNLMYGILGPNETVVAYNFSRSSRGFGTPVWSSQRIPGLSNKQPVLNVDSTTDQIYFIHPVDGKIYCYDASLGANTTRLMWTSSVVCSAPSNSRSQHLQAFTANGQRLLARCNNTVVLLGPNGTLLKTFASASVQAWVNGSDLAAPIAVTNNFTRMLTWFTNSGGSNLEFWQLNGTTSRPTKAASTIRLPAGVNVSGVTTDSVSWVVITDANTPSVHTLNLNTSRFATVYNFKTLVDPDDTMTITVLPTPVMVNNTMYGVIQGLQPSPFPWMLDQYPDKFYWWFFALDYTNNTVPKTPALRWITPQQATRGPVASQVPWVTTRAVFITDYQQNATRSFDRATGQTWFNVPGNPYNPRLTAYSLTRGTYKISLPWVSQDGLFEVLQFASWEWDLATPQDRVDGGISRGNIRTMTGLIFGPPPPPPPPSPPRPPQI